MAYGNPFIQDPQQRPGHEPVPLLPLQNTSSMLAPPNQQVVNLLPGADKIPGILGATPSDKAPAKRSFLDKLLGIYSDADLSEDQRKELQNQGLLQAGLAIMAASGQGASLGEALYGGVQAGQGAVKENMAASQQKSMQERFKEIAATNPEAIPAMLQEAIASGADPATINALSNAANSLAQAKNAGQGSKAKGQVQPKLMDDGTYHNVLLDPTDGSVLSDLGPVQPERGVVVSTVDAQGRSVDKLVDPRTGRPIATFEQPEKAPSLTEEGAATDARLVTSAVADVEAALEKLGRGPSFLEYQAYKHDATRGTVNNDMQGLLQAQEALVSILARVVTGSVRAAASPQIRDAINRSFLVAPGDSPQNREQTIRNLQMIRDRLQTEAGRAWIRDQAGVTQDMIDSAGTERADSAPRIELDAGDLSPEDF